MYLNLDGSNSDGLFYIQEGDWIPVYLSGSWKPDVFDFSGELKDQKPVGRLQVQIADNLFLGQWTPAGSDQAEPVRLTVVPKTECDGKGAWKRFDSPKWPFSFSYPASWHLMEEHDGPGDYIRLICPDPEEMIYDTDVAISEGERMPPRVSGLVRCGKEWRYDADCDEDTKDSVYNHDPTQSVRHGMKILDTSVAEWRMYCRNGGYVGQGYGTDIFILSQNSWMEITKELDASDIVGRIMDTIRAHTAKSIPADHELPKAKKPQ